MWLFQLGTHTDQQWWCKRYDCQKADRTDILTSRVIVLSGSCWCIQQLAKTVSEGQQTWQRSTQVQKSDIMRFPMNKTKKQEWLHHYCCMGHQTLQKPHTRSAPAILKKYMEPFKTLWHGGSIGRAVAKVIAESNHRCQQLYVLSMLTQDLDLSATSEPLLIFPH